MKKSLVFAALFFTAAAAQAQTIPGMTAPGTTIAPAVGTTPSAPATPGAVLGTTSGTGLGTTGTSTTGLSTSGTATGLPTGGTGTQGAATSGARRGSTPVGSPTTKGAMIPGASTMPMPGSTPR